MTDDLMLELYAAFETAKPAFEAAGLPPIAMIDRMRGQPLQPEQFEYYPLPAIFIGRSVQWEQVGNVWNGDMALDFHLVAEPTWEASSIATNKVEGLKYYRLLNAVRRVIDGFRSERIGNLKRSNDREVDTGVVIYDVLGYRCAYFENDVARADTEIEEVGINPGLVRKL